MYSQGEFKGFVAYAKANIALIKIYIPFIRYAIAICVMISDASSLKTGTQKEWMPSINDEREFHILQVFCNM